MKKSQYRSRSSNNNLILIGTIIVSFLSQYRSRSSNNNLTKLLIKKNVYLCLNTALAVVIIIKIL